MLVVGFKRKSTHNSVWCSEYLAGNSTNGRFFFIFDKKKKAGAAKSGLQHTICTKQGRPGFF